jgi:hypothetical protein
MATPSPSVILTNTPPKWNLTYGANVYSFYDLNSTAPKFAIQVIDTSGNVKADLRQTSNQAGYAHFDIQHILKNYVDINPTIENTILYGTSNSEVFRYKIVYGYENSTGGTTSQGTIPSTASTNDYIVLNGRKDFNVLNWNSNPYQIKAQQLIGCPIIVQKSRALTDWTYDMVDGAALTGGKPAYVGAGINVYQMKMRRGDYYTLSFMNEVLSGATANLTTNKKIGGFRITLMSGTTQLNDNMYANITTFGGGPGTSVSSTTNISAPYDVINLACGANNTIISGNPFANRIFISGYLYAPSGCNPIFTSYTTSPCTDTYMIEIVDDECNDFEPIQVSWLNSFGFRDYFYFQKRVDKSININRLTYTKTLGNWNGATYTIPTYDRGDKVYREDLDEVYSINTRYLSDNEAQYLKNLFISPDVKVRLNGDTNWYSVVLTDTSWVERTYRKDKLFQYTLNFRFSNKLNIQNG